VSTVLIVTIAFLTYASRALALVFMPTPPARLTAVLDRIPSALFAALAVTSLVPDGQLAAASIVSAAIGAVIAAPTRSLLLILAAGLGGYGVGLLLFN
jgi:branched-subunit amino acid transport protein